MKAAIISFTRTGNECGARVADYFRGKGMAVRHFTAARRSKVRAGRPPAEEKPDCEERFQFLAQENPDHEGSRQFLAQEKTDHEGIFQCLAGEKPDCEGKPHAPVLLTESLASWTSRAFLEYDALIYIGAAAIAVRSIAPCLKDKLTDPAVLVIDEKGQYVIPVLSGHVGGANELAMELADFLAAIPVITTATDIQGLFAVDVFAVKNGLVLTDRQKAKKISADILEKQELGIYMAEGIYAKDRLPAGLKPVQKREEGRIIVDYRGMPWVSVHKMATGEMETGTAADNRIKNETENGAAANNAANGADESLLLIPKKMLWLGVGCRRGTETAYLEAALEQFMMCRRICPEAVAGLASIDVKAHEKGILQVCEKRGWEFKTFTVEILAGLAGDFSASDFVRRQVGVDNVCERAAVCAAGGERGRLLVGKQRYPGITLALAREERGLNFTAGSRDRPAAYQGGLSCE